MKKTFTIIGALIIFLFVLVGFVSLRRHPLPIIISTTPSNYSSNVLTSSPLIITFAVLSPAQQRQITLTSSPDQNLQLTWPSPNTLLATPTAEWLPDTHYQIGLFYQKSPLAPIDFTTNSFSTAELTQQQLQQAQDDYDVGVALNQIAQNYPWINFLAITQSDYQVIFHHQKKLFRLALFTPPNPSNLSIIVAQAAKLVQNQGFNLYDPGYYIVDSNNRIVPNPQ